jgi:hypothetical protein
LFADGGFEFSFLLLADGIGGAGWRCRGWLSIPGC